MMKNQDTTRRLMQQLNLNKKAKGAMRDDNVSNASEAYRKAYKVLPQGALLKPVVNSARSGTANAS